MATESFPISKRRLSSSSTSKASPQGEIAALIVLCFLFVVFIGIVVFLYVRKERSKQKDTRPQISYPIPISWPLVPQRWPLHYFFVPLQSVQRPTGTEYTSCLFSPNRDHSPFFSGWIDPLKFEHYPGCDALSLHKSRSWHLAPLTSRLGIERPETPFSHVGEWHQLKGGFYFNLIAHRI